MKRVSGADERERLKVDWRTIGQKMKAFESYVDRGWTPSPEAMTKILQERAKSLAAELVDDKSPGNLIEVVEFLLSYETYGIESFYIREIHMLKEFTPVPCTPSFVLGIMNVRGQIISIIDMKNFFDLPPRGLTEFNKVIIIRKPGMEFGILADAVLGVRFIPGNEIQQPLPTFTGARMKYLKGITPTGMAILDADKILSDKKIVVNNAEGK
jgi:purine-binding chemotaxis protein CheW